MADVSEEGRLGARGLLNVAAVAARMLLQQLSLDEDERDERDKECKGCRMS